jgi:hypothetical protein
MTYRTPSRKRLVKLGCTETQITDLLQAVAQRKQSRIQQQLVREQAELECRYRVLNVRSKNAKS